jgi:two-component system, chemotaxis family, chemotaxis protein CheY
MKKVLIVDDATFMRLTISKAMHGSDFEMVGEAGNGVVAVQKYKELKPDVVTMDITMPDMDGITAIKKIKETDPNCKIIVISAMGQDNMVKQALVAGAKNFIVKPFNPETLITALNKLLE